jgi:hypothetical protein
MEHKFVSESIKPVIATADTGAMATGGPGLPHEFTWRGKAPDSKGQCRLILAKYSASVSGSCRFPWICHVPASYTHKDNFWYQAKGVYYGRA